MTNHVTNLLCINDSRLLTCQKTVITGSWHKPANPAGHADRGAASAGISLCSVSLCSVSLGPANRGACKRRSDISPSRNIYRIWRLTLISLIWGTTSVSFWVQWRDTNTTSTVTERHIAESGAGGGGGDKPGATMKTKPNSGFYRPSIALQ